jgi:thioredoxin-related protein
MRAPTCSRRRWLAGATLLAAAPWAGLVQAAPASLPAAVALADELKQALAAGGPLLVMVSLEGCPFCRVARENYLSPLRERHGLAVVQVDMRSKQMLKNFQGGLQSHDDWIRAQNVRVAPTVLFFGRAGVEIVERMAGGYIPDFYGAYLDERLRQAKTLLAG